MSVIISKRDSLFILLHYLCIMEYRQLSHEEYSDLESRILFEDNHLLIVCKKVGEITQGDKTGDECLADNLKPFWNMRQSVMT